ncbi:hypothetical protein BDQ17DRAFT_1325793 [Cyathus striatus]|nr:hypothetical protein BDQ17DRAFT_1325793 [Cyathus striatus]
MSSESVIDQIQLLHRTIQQLNQSNYAAAALTALVYDTLLTFGREYEHIWKAKWSLPMILYFCTRYYGVLRDSKVARNIFGGLRCRGGPIIFTTTVNVILILRLHALYNHNFKVLLFLIISLLAEFGSELFISTKVAMIAAPAVFTAPLGLPIPGCLTSVETKFTLGSWIPCLLVAFLFFFMTMVKFFKSTQKGGRTAAWKLAEQKSFSPLLMTFFRDGTVFFFVIAVTLLVCTLITTLVKGPLEAVFIPDQDLSFNSEKLQGDWMGQLPGVEQFHIKSLSRKESQEKDLEELCGLLPMPNFTPTAPFSR